MKRILFVDDEQQILDGLRTMFHRKRNEWEMQFVSSGQAAIAELERQPFDLICCDMRMPGMDGAQVLTQVAERWPETVRIVLSGYSELAQTIRLVPIAHQYLSKPCDAKRIETTIERCWSVQELVRNKEVRALVGRVKKLPAIPKTYQNLCAAMAKPDIGGGELAKIVSSDAAIAVRVLQVSNSAFFRLSRQITKIEQAVSYLGFTAIRNLALSAEVFSASSGLASLSGLSLDAIRNEAIKTAAAMREFTKGTPHADDAFVVGLLHNIGLLIFIETCPDKLVKALEESKANQISLLDAERKHIGATHAEVGAYLLSIWGLPYSIVDAVANQNETQRAASEEFDLWAALTIALKLLSDEKQLSHTAVVDVDAAFLTKVHAPFSWEDAQQTMRSILQSGEL